MTAREAIERARVFRPNAAKDEVMLSWLSELEGRVHVEIFLLDVHDTAPIFDMDTELFAKYPHDAIYEAYLIMQTDLYHKEYDAFSASRMRFDELWGVFARYMATYHRPADDAKMKGRGAGCDRVGHTLGTVQPFWSTKEAYIGVNGNWWYGGLDTGIKGIGRDGLDGEGATIDVEKTDDGIRLILKDSRGTNIAEIKNGITPHIENGMWYIGDQNTGIKAEGVDGHTPQKGVDYFTEEDKAELGLTVDQSYSAESENAQSGKAVAEALSWKPLAAFTLDKAQEGISSIVLALPTWELLKTASCMRIEAEIKAGDETISSQILKISVSDKNAVAYEHFFCYATAYVEAGQSGFCSARYEFGENTYFTSGGTSRRRYAGYYTEPTIYTGPNSIGYARSFGDAIVPEWMAQPSYPPYLRMELLGGGMFAAGTSLRVEVC